MKALHELRTLDFSIENITVKAESWEKGAGHDYLETGRTQNIVHIVTGGSRDYITENGRFTVGVGTLLFISHGTRYYTAANDDCSGIGILFDIVSSGSEISIGREVLHCQSSLSGPCHSLMREMSDLSLSGQGFQLRIKVLMWQLIELIIYGIGNDSTVSKQIAPAVRFIDEHYRENLPTAEYAAVCHLSESYFRRIFTDHIGMTPLEYRDSLRFAEAHRLRASGMTITQAAESVGFCDASYMRRLYKQRTGRAFRDGLAESYV